MKDYAPTPMYSKLKRIFHKEKKVLDETSTLLEQFRKERNSIHSNVRRFGLLPFWNMHNMVEIVTELPEGEWITDENGISLFYMGSSKTSGGILMRAHGELPPVYTDKHERIIKVVKGFLEDTVTGMKYYRKQELTIPCGCAKHLNLFGTIAVVFIPPFSILTKTENAAI